MTRPEIEHALRLARLACAEAEEKWLEASLTLKEAQADCRRAGQIHERWCDTVRSLMTLLADPPDEVPL